MKHMESVHAVYYIAQCSPLYWEGGGGERNCCFQENKYIGGMVCVGYIKTSTSKTKISAAMKSNRDRVRSKTVFNFANSFCY